jgi:formylglycine-generating enzyme required for sulfatase activity
LLPQDSQAFLLREVRRRGVDFELTANAEAELRGAGAHPELIAAVRDSFRGSATDSVTAKPTLPNLPRTRTNQAGIEFVLIPAGSFMMGATNGSSDEKPVHQVTISYAFYMGKYEVTQAQWQSVMGSNPSYFKDCGGNCPVEQVSWDDAQNFIQRLNQMNDGYAYRLPTEAEWEYACRAGTTGDYAGDPDAIGWYYANSGDARLSGNWNYDKSKANNNRTHSVGTKLPNAFDLFDMHGNVWEWCQDWYHDSYNGAPTDGSAWVSGGEQQSRVLRGGSWYFHTSFSRAANRGYRTTLDPRGFSNGFRVVAVARTQ